MVPNSTSSRCSGPAPRREGTLGVLNSPHSQPPATAQVAGTAPATALSSYSPFEIFPAQVTRNS